MKIYKISQSNALGESEYIATVRISAMEHGPNDEYDAVIDNKSTFHYNIEVEYRSWGIKDISVSFNDVLRETIVITYFDNNGNEIKTEDRPIIIDMSQLPIEYTDGDGVYVAGINIELTPNLEVDYPSSSIDVVRGGLK